MKIELHCHTSRYSGCAVSTPHEMMAALLAAGYGAVFITEHDAVWSDWELANLQAEFPAIRIFPGVELSFGTDTAEHLLVLGSHDERYTKLAAAEEVLAKARAEGHLTVLAHPFRWKGGDKMLQSGLLPDAIEHLTCNQGPQHAEIAAETAGRLKLPMVNADDAHSVEMVSQYWIETDRPAETPADIRRIIVEGAYKNCAK